MVVTLKFDLSKADQNREYIYAMEGHSYYKFISDIKEALIAADDKGAIEGLKELTKQQTATVTRARELFMELYKQYGIRDIE